MHLEATIAGSHLRILSLDASKLCSLAVGKLVHCGFGKVEAISSVINGQDIDSLAVVGDSVAGAALRNA